LSVEATVQRCSILSPAMGVAQRFGHANHLIHDGCDREAQIVTDSSRDRQARVDALLPSLRTPVTDDALLRVLRDEAPAGLPIFRDDPLDPDDENTLATALFRLEADGVAMQVYRQGHCAFDTFIPKTAAAQATF
ncbi:MAG: carcinine hydrolase/isopenicillin-N N-acyltransferase family protein, partial [Paraburkholderia sp.]